MATVTMTTMTLTWGRVDCILRNSDIIGYRITSTSFYGNNSRDILGTGVENRTTTYVNLIPNTVYTFGVAAINVDGLVGPELIVNMTTIPVEGEMKY